MKDFLIYLLWPNPPTPDYGDTKVITVLLLCGLLIFASFAIKHWRKRQSNAMTRKLSRSWSTACLWFGFVGLFLAVCRVEGISYISMRVWWGVWVVSAALYIALQVKLFTLRHYTVLPHESAPQDPKEKYLPKRKRK